MRADEPELHDAEVEVDRQRTERLRRVVSGLVEAQEGCETEGRVMPLRHRRKRLRPIRKPDHKAESLILRATSLGSPAMAERTRRRKAKSAGARKATKRARTKGRAARGKTAKPKKKTTTKRKAAAATRTRPSPRRPAKATAPAPRPEAQAPPAGKRPAVTAPSTETVQRPGDLGQAAAATRTRPSLRRPAEATAPAAKPEAQTPPAGRHPEAPAPSVEAVQRPGEPGQPPSDGDDT
jgi:hypothetical protein